MNHACDAFWMLHTPIGLLPIPPGFDLTYGLDFLEPVPTPAISAPYDIQPPAPTLDLCEVERCAGDRTLWRGEL